MYFYKCQVLRVIDGDTLYVEIDLGFHIYIREYIRLIDIDTPEIRGIKASPDGKVAKQLVEDWVNEFGPSFTWRSVKYDQRDKYGRSLGILFPEIPTGPSLNDYLASKGWGVV